METPNAELGGRAIAAEYQRQIAELSTRCAQLAGQVAVLQDLNARLQSAPKNDGPGGESTPGV